MNVAVWLMNNCGKISWAWNYRLLEWSYGDSACEIIIDERYLRYSVYREYPINTSYPRCDRAPLSSCSVDHFWKEFHWPNKFAQTSSNKFCCHSYFLWRIFFVLLIALFEQLRYDEIAEKPQRRKFSVTPNKISQYSENTICIAKISNDNDLLSRFRQLKPQFFFSKA